MKYFLKRLFAHRVTQGKNIALYFMKRKTQKTELVRKVTSELYYTW